MYRVSRGVAGSRYGLSSASRILVGKFSVFASKHDLMILHRLLVVFSRNIV